MNIEVTITRNTKPYVGLITGASEKYGFELDFVRDIKRHSAKHHTITITAPGTYKLPEDVTINNRGITSGYIQVAEDGAVTEITKDQATATIA